METVPAVGTKQAGGLSYVQALSRALCRGARLRLVRSVARAKAADGMISRHNGNAARRVAEARRLVLRIRVNTIECARIEQAACDIGLTVSEYIRDAATGRASRRRLTQSEGLRLVAIAELVIALENLEDAMPDEPTRAQLRAILLRLHSVFDVL